MTRRHHFFDHAIRSTAVAPCKGIDSLIQKRSIRVAQKSNSGLICDLAIDGAGHQLIQDRQRVTHRTATGADDQGKDTFTDANMLLIAQSLQVGFQNIRRNQAERIVMRAGTNGSNDALRFRRRKDELHVLGRLFYELEQSVEALGADHVGFVDDEDLVAVTHRCKSSALT